MNSNHGMMLLLFTSVEETLINFKCEILLKNIRKYREQGQNCFYIRLAHVAIKQM